MKAATIPAVRVEEELRSQVEHVLQEGETLSSFVESSVRDAVRRRIEQSEFVARGMASLIAAEQSGRYVAADDVVAKLQKRLDKARAAQRKPRTTKR